MTSKIAKIAAAGAVAAVVAGAGSQAFAADKTQNALIGAAVGALAGSLLSHGDTGAVVAGAAVGGLLGVATSNDDHHRRYATPTYRTSQSYRGYAAYPAYRNDRRDYDRGHAVRYDRDYRAAQYRGW